MADQSPYMPVGEWISYDFQINECYWEKKGIKKADGIRKSNLLDVRNVLLDMGVLFWLQGRTLLGLFCEGELPDDHDDDLGIWIGQRETVLASVCRELEEIGFTKIRDTRDIISFEREYRYIDICIFRRLSKSHVGYSNKKFASNHFERFDTLKWKNVDFFIPSKTALLLESMYPLDFGIEINPVKKIKHILFTSLRLIPRVLKAFKRRIPAYVGRHPTLNLTLLSILSPIHRNKVGFLTEDEFLDLEIEPDDSFNWNWRARHLNIVTENAKYRKVRDIIGHLSSEAVVEMIEKNIAETDTSKPFIEPSNLDVDFWWGGNNYFWYCIKFGFRKNVVAYADVNDYILAGKEPVLFTADYYESLPLMTDTEVRKLLSCSAIEIEDGAITSGKHRVFAMVGRILAKKRYLPIRAVDVG